MGGALSVFTGHVLYALFGLRFALALIEVFIVGNGWAYYVVYSRANLFNARLTVSSCHLMVKESMQKSIAMKHTVIVVDKSKLKMWL